MLGEGLRDCGWRLCGTGIEPSGFAIPIAMVADGRFNVVRRHSGESVRLAFFKQSLHTFMIFKDVSFFDQMEYEPIVKALL